MNITYTWEFRALDYKISFNGESYVVTGVHHTLVATDELENSDSHQHFIALPTDTLDSFISYENLTKDIVVGWLESLYTEEDLQGLKASLRTNIEEQRSPTKGWGIPWEEEA
tara:strand:- start:634 stop:969 length:336 start_codon:yes stop_codon:yes gene_type:complete